MWDYISRFILNNRILLLITILAISAFMAYQGSKIQLSFAGSKVLPVTDSSYLAYEDFKKKYGEDGSILVVGFNSEKIFERQTFNDWYNLTNELKKLDGIKDVLSLGSIYELTKDTTAKRFALSPLLKDTVKTDAEMDSVKAAILGLQFYDGLLFNSNSGAVLMAISFDSQVLNSKKRVPLINQIEEATERFAEKNNIELNYSGLPWMRTKFSDKVAGEFILFLGLSLLTTAIVLLLFFRSFYAVVFPVLVVSLGVIWALGVIVMLGYQITLLIGLVPPLIVVIGIPNCVLLLNKYHKEFTRTGDKMLSLRITIQKIGVTALLANVSAAIGFGVFFFTNSEVLEQFGLVAAINIMSTYIISLICIPIIFSFLPPPTKRHTKHLDNKFLVVFLNKIDFLVHNYRTRIYIATAILVCISLFGISKMKVNAYVVDDLPKNDPILTNLQFFEQNFDGILPFEVVVDTRRKNGVINLPTIRKVEELQDLIKSYPEFSRPISLNEVLKFSTQAFYNGEPSFYTIPSTMELGFIMQYAGQSQGSDNLLKGFLDSTRQETRISFQMKDVGSFEMNKIMDDLRVKADSIFPPDRFDVKFTGSSLLFITGTEYLITHLQIALILAITLISLIIYILFRSFRMNGIALLPNIVSLLFTAGIMGYFGISLKPSTIMIFSVALGLANDQTIYFLIKYRQELANSNWSVSKVVSLAIGETGVSMIYAASILFFGFGIFTLSTFGGTVSLGFLMAITLLVALLSNLLLLPALLLTLDKRNSRKKATKPLVDIDNDLE